MSKKAAVRYTAPMPSRRLELDPLAGVPDDRQRVRGSLWWGHSSHKYARDPSHGAGSEHLKGLLAAGEWTDPPSFDKASARSLMAWRGLWSVPRLDLIEALIDSGLCPPSDHPMDWWPVEHFRTRSLRKVFLPTYPAPSPSSPASVLEDYRKREQDRIRVEKKLSSRYPGLLALMFPRPGQPSRTSPYGHPVLVVARTGMEEAFQRFLSEAGTGIVFGDGESPGLLTPVQALELGLKRRFEPLIDLALAAGATVDDPAQDYRGSERSLLHAAIAAADHAMVDWLLAQGPRLETWDRFARTPFLVAARMSDVSTMEKLLAAGANAGAVDRFGQTAAHLAVEGISTTMFDKKAFAANGSRQYVDKTAQQVEQGLVRAGHAVAWLGAHGVDLSVPCAPAPKKSKTKDSPYSGLPRASRQPSSAKVGETWEEQLARRCADTQALGDKGRSVFQAAKMATALEWLLPEPEEGGVEPPSTAPLTPRRARM